MSAGDHLSDQQFEQVPMKRLKKMYSGDYDERMPQVKDLMRQNWAEYEEGYHDEPHSSELKHGGAEHYLRYLKDDIAKNGIRKPIKVRGGNVVVDGNHRAVAAMELGLSHVPVKHIR